MMQWKGALARVWKFGFWCWLCHCFTLGKGLPLSGSVFPDKQGVCHRVCKVFGIINNSIIVSIIVSIS